MSVIHSRLSAVHFFSWTSYFAVIVSIQSADDKLVGVVQNPFILLLLRIWFMVFKRSRPLLKKTLRKITSRFEAKLALIDGILRLGEER